MNTLWVFRMNSSRKLTVQSVFSNITRFTALWLSQYCMSTEEGKTNGPFYMNWSYVHSIVATSIAASHDRVSLGGTGCIQMFPCSDWQGSGAGGLVVFVYYFIFCLNHIIYLAVLVNRNVSQSVSSSGQDPRIPVRNQVPLYSVAKKLPPASRLSTASWRCPQNCLFVRLMLSACLQSSAGRYETCNSSPWSSSPSILQPLTVPANFGIKMCSAKSLSGMHTGSCWLLHSACSWSCSNAMLFSPVSSSYRMCMCFLLTCIIIPVPLVPLGPVKQWHFTALRNNLSRDLKTACELTAA